MHIEIHHIFHNENADFLLEGRHLQRQEPKVPQRVLLDRFSDSKALCAFIRAPLLSDPLLSLNLAGNYRLEACPSGGWLLSPETSNQDSYWIPQPPQLRKLDDDGHILSHRAATITALSVTSYELTVDIQGNPGENLDLTLWRLPASEPDLLEGLLNPLNLELQPVFLWSSHTTYTHPADLYLHLIHGHIYENHEVWPRYWRICSELDAHALYVTLKGLEKATGKRLYTLLKHQVVLSVIDRQAEDGGWYHGEWTDGMESHYRLVNGALQLLAAHLEDKNDPLVRMALEKGIAFLVERAQSIGPGLWFMHDSLESSEDSIRDYPFPWEKSRALGKSISNLLILNTHLDTLVTLGRYQEVTGDQRYHEQISSAREATRSVMELDTANWFYKSLFRILDLTLLPKKEARNLPLPLRAIKRIGWKYLSPRLHKIKCAFPRLVMPNGYIDRALCQKGFSTRYQSVHVWDLVRYLRRFPDERLKPILERALEYTHSGPIRAHWAEAPERQDALGFWVEALYHLYMLDPHPRYRQWLAEAALDCIDAGLGLPPSCLGSHSEILNPGEGIACLSPQNLNLRVINLSRQNHMEFLVINPTNETAELHWQSEPPLRLHWPEGSPNPDPNSLTIPGKGWVLVTGIQDKVKRFSSVAVPSCP